MKLKDEIKAIFTTDNSESDPNNAPYDRDDRNHEGESAADINRKHNLEGEHNVYRRANSPTARRADATYVNNIDQKPYIESKSDAEDTASLPGPEDKQ